jgi:hypothetical protein
MDFRLEFIPQPFELKIKHSEKLFLIGSCFTEQIGAKLSHHKFRTIENPNGILFNPLSITQSISSYISNKQYTEADLFFHNEIWGSWDHHTKFSSIHKAECFSKINHSQQQAHDFLQQTDWLLITLGSSFVYMLDKVRAVANCHKVPTDKFDKILLTAEQIMNELQIMITELQAFNPGIKIIFTISPVRHLRDGFVENNRSKANLITAVHQLTEQCKAVYYFPAYELVIDDLRDYRFFAEDMVHPNYQATNYVWEKFIYACINEEAKLLMKEINSLKAAFHHKPFNPESNQHNTFLLTNFKKAEELKLKYNYLELEDLLSYFKSATK